MSRRERASCSLVRNTRLKAYRLPAYPDLIKLGKERKGALFLDIGCCVGNDVRKTVADGYPADQIIASDLKAGMCTPRGSTRHPRSHRSCLAEFWDIGHKLFNSTQETFPVKFLAGDVFDKDFLAPAPIATTPPASPAPDIPGLKSLTPLHGRLSAIHASSFFHLFNEEKQAELAHLLGSLLSPEPGSMIFGMHGARPERGTHSVRFGSGEAVVDMFSHGPESWKALWEDVFGKDKVEVQVVVEDADRKDIPTNEKFYWMVYSVKRL